MLSKIKKEFVLFVTILFFGITATAQTGTINGKVIDKKTGETLLGASVFVEGTTLGTTTDLDGNYTLKLQPGTYNLKCRYISYQDLTVKNVIVVEGKTQKMDFTLESAEMQLNEVVIEAVQVKNTDASLISMQRRSIAVQDGISAQQISRTGSTNAAESMKQMTGANVQDGKYLVMRGLGDRYSISQLNGLPMASADPYRNSSSLDLIPASFIENIVTIKTFTPDQPGNFTGGNVDITSKSFPETFSLNFASTIGFNTISNWQDDFLSSEKDNKEWLGYYGSKRALDPMYLDDDFRDKMTSSSYIEARKKDGSPETRDFFNKSAKGFNNSFVPTQMRSPLNQRYEISTGNQFKLFKKDFGFIIGARYSVNYQDYNDGIITTWLNNQQPELFAYQDLKDNRSVENPQVGTFGNLSVKLNKNNQINGTFIYSNDAEIMGRQQNGKFVGQVSNSFAEFNTNSTQFTQRELMSYQLSGKHMLSFIKDAEINWAASYNDSKQDEPDLKYFAYTTVTDSFDRVDANGNPYKSLETEYYLNNAEYARPYHFFRYLRDKQIQGRVDITLPFTKNKQNKIKFGGFFTETNRDFKEYRFEMADNNIPGDIRFTEYIKNNGPNFDQLFSSNNFGIIDTVFNSNGEVTRYTTGYYYANQTSKRNFYTGKQRISAAYVMSIYNLTEKIKLVGGVRMEATDIEVQSLDTNKVVVGGELVEARGEIKLVDFLPSINLIYSLNEKTNLRFSATQTVARPNLREISPFVQFDNKNGFFSLGNPKLKRTTIQNFDARYEFYPKPGELIAVSAYAKIFRDPIVQAFNNTTIPELVFINVDKAEVYGVELEVRKSFDFISERFKNYSFSGNISYIFSKVNMPEDEIKTSKSFDPTFNQTSRPFAGQAPYIVNLILSYINRDFGNETAISFNVSGRKLYQIALVATPDIYENPIPTLNFKTTQRVYKNFNASFTVQNILNAQMKKVQNFKGKEYIAEQYAMGTLFQLGISYNFKK